MPLLSFYLIDGKRRFWLDLVSSYPTDWFQLKMILVEVAEKVHLEHKKTHFFVSLERHLPGKSFVRFSGKYRQKKIPFQRQYEAFLKLVFNPQNKDTTVKQASFNYTLFHVREGFWRMERGIRWRSPPLIPREHRNLSDPKRLLMHPSATRYADYSRKSRERWDEKKPRTSYRRLHIGVYLPRTVQRKEKAGRESP